MPLTSAEIIADPIAHYPAATIACFDPTCGKLPRRQLDEGRTVAMLERYAALAVPAVLIASSTGHGHLRSLGELEAWFRCAARADCGGMVRIALLRPEDGLEINRRLLDLLAESAFPVVFLRPGTDLRADADDAAVSASLAPLVAEAAARGLAIGLYTIPDVSGISLTAEAASQLVESKGGDHIVAVKVTEADYEASTARFLAHPALAGLKIVQGWDPHLLRALREGGERVGITSGLMALAVYQYQHLLEAAGQKQWQEAEASQQAATALFAAMQDDPQHFADLQRAKYIMGLGHPLTSAVSGKQVGRVFGALQQLNRKEDRRRLARSLDLMGDGPFHQRLVSLADGSG
jgi:dihydrodipicolinate synthase/N-acetylneuraminate lyase